MPPLWFILGSTVIIGLTLLADRLVLRRRGYTVKVDGRPVELRQRRDNQILFAIMLAMFVVLVGGASIIEGDLALGVLFAIPIGLMIAVTLRRTARPDDPAPTESDVRARMRISRSMTRQVWLGFVLIAVEFLLGALQGVVDGVLAWILLAAMLALLPLALCGMRGGFFVGLANRHVESQSEFDISV
jgi:hypothetical protein